MSAPQCKSVAAIAAMIPLVIVASAVPAYADMCVPMVALVWPASWWLLLFIVPIETLVGLRILQSSRITTVKMVVAANVASTLVGIPFLLVVFYFAGATILQTEGINTPLFGQDHWNHLTITQQAILVVTQGGPLRMPWDSWSWTSLASAMVLCIPSFFLSVWLEYLVGRAFFSKEQWGSVRRWAWIANAFSYAFVLLVLGSRLLWITLLN